MDTFECQYCRETIKKDAIKCKHCHSVLRTTREDMMLAAIQTHHVLESVKVGPVSACEASCYGRHLSKAQLTECLDNCKAIEAARMVYERLHKELNLSFYEIIWGGGDIDPLPLERELRKRLSRMSGDR